MNATNVLILLSVITAFAVITLLIPTRNSFRPAALSLIVSALFVGFINVGLLYTFGIPLVPMTHIVITNYKGETQVNWLGPVSDDGRELAVRSLSLDPMRLTPATTFPVLHDPSRCLF